MRRLKALSLCGFLWFAGCASYSWNYVENLPTGTDGRTGCLKGKPHVEIRKGLPEAWSEVVVAHESIHVRQAQRFPSCKSFLSKYAAEPNYRVDAEAEAFCKTSYAWAVDQKAAQSLIVLTLLMNYGTGLRPEAVDSVVSRWCMPERR